MIFEAMMSFVCEKKLQRRPWVKLKAVFWQDLNMHINCLMKCFKEPAMLRILLMFRINVSSSHSPSKPNHYIWYDVDDMADGVDTDVTDDAAADYVHHETVPNECG
uniref:Uncharacterized protein n=1 Tax=Lactuca sativa TaxID=4236 RepID=A0A9R1UV45_LACSA|nr:hypothetical protein LSAT_V11C800443310 [Lactuca sativa]